MPPLKALASLMILSSSLSVFAQGSAKIPLWPEGIPGAKTSGTYKEEIILTDNDPAKPRISKVTAPELEVFLPAPEKINGTAVVICPGGGYARLAYDHEGIQVAKWFNELGVTAFILKYRLPSDEIMEDKSVGPLQDAQEAIRVVRRRAAEFKLKSGKIGILGFSAGGHLAASASTRFAELVYKPSDFTSARPDFSVLCYGVISMQNEITHKGSQTNLLGNKPATGALGQASNELRVDASTPPAFLVHSQDDTTVPVENSIRYFQAMTAFGIPGELHIHQRGGHGYGLGNKENTPKHWSEDLKVWLKINGLL